MCFWGHCLAWIDAYWEVESYDWGRVCVPVLRCSKEWSFHDLLKSMYNFWIMLTNPSPSVGFSRMLWYWFFSEVSHFLSVAETLVGLQLNDGGFVSIWNLFHTIVARKTYSPCIANLDCSCVAVVSSSLHMASSIICGTSDEILVGHPEPGFLAIAFIQQNASETSIFLVLTSWCRPQEQGTQQ